MTVEVDMQPVASGEGSMQDENGEVVPSKQQQNDEAQAPLDDQERRAVQKRLQRKADERRAQLKDATNNGSMSVRSARTVNNGSMSYRMTGGPAGLGPKTGASTPKGWLSGRLTGRRGGYLSSRSTGQSTSRSMMSTSRSMMTTARSDMATGRYQDAIEDAEATETRILEMRKTLDNLKNPHEEERRRGRSGEITGRSGKTPRSGKLPSSMSTAASLRAGLLRRGVQLRNARNNGGNNNNATGRTPRTARMGMQSQRQPGERPSHGG